MYLLLKYKIHLTLKVPQVAGRTFSAIHVPIHDANTEHQGAMWAVKGHAVFRTFVLKFWLFLKLSTLPVYLEDTSKPTSKIKLIFFPKYSA